MSAINAGTGIIGAFGRCKRGATAVIFALAAVPLLAIAGGLLDYSRAVRVKSELAVVLDTAVLAATQAYALDDSVDVKQIIENYVAKNYTESGKTLLSLTPVLGEPEIAEDGEITANLTVEVKTHILGLIGRDKFAFGVSSSARVGGQTLELALVLDNTGSMQGSKISSLKDSAQELVDALMVPGQDNVQLAVVPFADYVKIDKSERFEPGLDIPDDFTVTTPASGEHCWTTYPNSTRECTPVKGWGTCSNDGAEYSCYKTLSWDCSGDRGEGVRHCEPRSETTKDYNWHGCMASRPDPLNTIDADYATGVPGLMKWCGVPKMTRLTDAKADITEALTKMTANGRTYIPSGLAWGWRAISNMAPFADGSAADDDNVKKAIVLMTDGANTIARKHLQDDSTSKHAGEVWSHDVRKNVGDATEADNYTATLCQNIAAEGITIHTIAFGVEDGSPVQALMKDCASTGNGQYFDAKDSEQLSAAFKKIALALLNLRLSK